MSSRVRVCSHHAPPRTAAAARRRRRRHGHHALAAGGALQPGRRIAGGRPAGASLGSCGVMSIGASDIGGVAELGRSTSSTAHWVESAAALQAQNHVLQTQVQALLQWKEGVDKLLLHHRTAPNCSSINPIAATAAAAEGVGATHLPTAYDPPHGTSEEQLTRMMTSSKAFGRAVREQARRLRENPHTLHQVTTWVCFDDDTAGSRKVVRDPSIRASCEPATLPLLLLLPAAGLWLLALLLLLLLLLLLYLDRPARAAGSRLARRRSSRVNACGIGCTCRRT
jgi:hypothetical protein